MIKEIKNSLIRYYLLVHNIMLFSSYGGAARLNIALNALAAFLTDFQDIVAVRIL